MIGRLMKLSMVVALAGVTLGIWLGATRAPYGPAPLKTVDATAKYESPETGLGMAWRSAIAASACRTGGLSTTSRSGCAADRDQSVPWAFTKATICSASSGRQTIRSGR